MQILPGVARGLARGTTALAVVAAVGLVPAAPAAGVHPAVRSHAMTPHAQAAHAVKAPGRTGAARLHAPQPGVNRNGTPAGPSTLGTDFWLAFALNPNTPTVSLLIAGPEATTGTVTWPDSSTAAFTVTPGQVTSVTVNNSLLIGDADGVADKGIHITSGKPITVYGLNAAPSTSDAFVAIPTNALGTRYRALSYRTTITSYPSRMMIVATADGTSVSITPKEALGGRPAGTPYTVSLDAGEVYSVTAPSTTSDQRDVTGTLVGSTKPVAVLAGVDCGNVGAGACDHVMEQMPPTTAWGTSFLTVRFAKAAPTALLENDTAPGRVPGVAGARRASGVVGARRASGVVGARSVPGTAADPADRGPAAATTAANAANGANLGDPVRVLADQDGTEVTVNGDSVATLNAGEYYETPLMTVGENVGAVIMTTKPALVSQYMTAGAYGDPPQSGDPSSLIVPPYEQYLSSYTLATAGSIFPYNAINVAVPTAAISGFRLDGAPVAGSNFAPIGDTGFSSAQLAVANGTHNLSATRPFGAFSYGAAGSNSYAYAGGASFAPVASIADVEVTPSSVTAAINARICLTATVTDSNGDPVEGVRGDLAVTGANAGAAASAATNSSGVASLCYTGTVAGTDTATVTAGSYSDTSTVTWSVAPTPPDAPGAPVVTAGDSAARVGWAAPDTHGSAITGYTVTATPGGATCTAEANTRTCVVIGLTNGQRYAFTVVAHSGAGNSPASAPTAGTPANEPGSGIGLTRSTVSTGGTTTVTARGFKPGTVVRFVVQSDPIFLGTAVANDQGIATLEVELPESLSGQHTILAVGTGASGEPLVESIAITVANGMPTTGDSIFRYGMIGFVLLLVGAGLVLAVRRWRRPLVFGSAG